MSAARLGALDSLQRGILNLKANWELVPLVWLQTVLMGALSVLSLLPFYFIFDIDRPGPQMSSDELAAWVMDLFAELQHQLGSPAFWLAVASSSAILTALLVCYSFFRAGALGIFATADRQAPPGRPTPAAWFRTYSWAEFQGRGGRHLWQFFWLLNLVLLFWLGWLLLAMIALLASGLVAGGAGVPAGLALGCASVLPLGFLLVLLAFWSTFGQALIAESGCSAWEGLRRGLGLMVRRMGAVLLLFVLMFLAYVTVAMFFLVLSLPLSTGLMTSGGAFELGATVTLQLLQWLAGVIIELTLVAAIVAIVRNELELERMHASS